MDNNPSLSSSTATSESSMNITVAVRCRGRNKREIDAKSPVIVSVPNTTASINHASTYPNEVSVNTTDDIGITAKLNSKTYKVDKVFGPNVSQEALFNDIIIPLFNDFIKGYNCTILVYGMTSTGKTYTMTGDENNNFIIKDKFVSRNNIKLSESAGIIPRILCRLFDTLEYEKNILNCNNSHSNTINDSTGTKQDIDYVVKCSFLELYNEELKDLLYDTTGSNSNDTIIPPSKKLKIFDNNGNNNNNSSSSSNNIINLKRDKNNKFKRSRKSMSNRSSLPISLEKSKTCNNTNTNNNNNNVTTTEIYIQNLREFHINNAKDGLLLLQNGLKQRQMASTKMNDFSSRSHTIFTITLYKKFKDQLFRLSKLNLVDLAGSENISKSGAINLRAKEAGSINQSLLTLGRVINSLSEINENKKDEDTTTTNNNNNNNDNDNIKKDTNNNNNNNNITKNKTKNIHIPFRESKLTRLLQDSLGGNTKTILIATISPAKLVLEETCSTLEYASKAKNIQNKPRLGSFIVKDMLLKDITQELVKLRADLWSTKSKDGIYMSQENYKNLMNEIEMNRNEIKELKQNNINLERSNTALLDENKRVNELLQRQNDKNTIISDQLIQIRKQNDKKDIQLNDLKITYEDLNKSFLQLNQNFNKIKEKETKLKSNIESVLDLEFHSLEDSIMSQLKKDQTLITNKSINNIGPNIQTIKDQVIQLLQNTKDKAVSLYNSCINDLLKETPTIFNQINDNITSIKDMTTIYYNDMAEKLSDLSEENNTFKQFLDKQLLIKDNIINNKTPLENDMINQHVEDTLRTLELSSNNLIQSLQSMIIEHFNNNRNLLTSTVDNVTKSVFECDNKELKPYFDKWQNSIELINKSDSINNKYWNQLNTHVEQVTNVIQNSRSLIDNSIKVIQSQDILSDQNMNIIEKINQDKIIDKNFKTINNNINILDQNVQKDFEFKKKSIGMIQGMEKKIRAIIHEEVENLINNDDDNIIINSGKNIENLKTFRSINNLQEQKNELQITVPLRPTSLVNTDYNGSLIPRSRSVSPKKRLFKESNDQNNEITSSKIPRISR